MGIIITLLFRKPSMVEDERMLQAEGNILQKKKSKDMKEHVTFALKA